MTGFNWQDLFKPQYPQLGNGNYLPSTQQAYGPQQQGFGGYGGYMMPQPSAAESLATALPFLSLPGKQERYMQPAYNTFAAAADPNSHQYQQIYGQQRQQGQENLAESIAELSRQNRKLSMLGRTPLFDQERGGEQVFRGLTQGYQNVQHQAADDTRAILAELAKGQMLQGQQRGQTAANKAGINANLLGAGAKFLPMLFGL